MKGGSPLFSLSPLFIVLFLRGLTVINRIFPRVPVGFNPTVVAFATNLYLGGTGPVVLESTSFSFLSSVFYLLFLLRD